MKRKKGKSRIFSPRFARGFGSPQRYDDRVYSETGDGALKGKSVISYLYQFAVKSIPSGQGRGNAGVF